MDADFRIQQLHERAQCVDLEVEDATGVVRVHAAGLELAITDSPVRRLDPPLPGALRELVPLHAQGMPVTVEEGLLLPGARILVCGVPVRERAATDYRDGTSHLVLRASTTFPLVASTDVDLFTPGERPIKPEELRRR